MELSLTSMTRSSLPMELSREPLVSVMGILASISPRESLSRAILTWVYLAFLLLVFNSLAVL